MATARTETELAAGTGEVTEELQREAQFEAIGDAAIDRALSNHDSRAFLIANRQLGGE